MGKWKFFLDGWEDFSGTLLSAVTIYFVILIFVRVSGKRTLAKMNVFDFICVVALGSMLSSTVLTPGVPLFRGLLGVAVILLIQYLLSFAACHFSFLQKIINGTPRLVFSRGKYLHHAMRSERVSEEILRAVIRAKGYSSEEEIFAIILETDGSFSLISADRARKSQEDGERILCDVHQ